MALRGFPLPPWQSRLASRVGSTDHRDARCFPLRPFGVCFRRCSCHCRGCPVQECLMKFFVRHGLAQLITGGCVYFVRGRFIIFPSPPAPGPAPPTSARCPFPLFVLYPAVRRCPGVGARSPDFPGQGDGARPPGQPGRERPSPAGFSPRRILLQRHQSPRGSGQASSSIPEFCCSAINLRAGAGKPPPQSPIPASRHKGDVRWNDQGIPNKLTSLWWSRRGTT